MAERLFYRLPSDPGVSWIEVSRVRLAEIATGLSIRNITLWGDLFVFEMENWKK